MKLSIVIPFCNNEGSVVELFDRLRQVSEHSIFEKCKLDLVLIEDGSKDNTYAALQKIVASDYPISTRLVKLTRNFGSYNAFLAGIYHAEGDCCVYLHSDLQDPPELIPEMLAYYLKGHKLIIANREDREDKNLFSTVYHWMVKKYALNNAPPGGFDLVLFDSKIKNDLIDISEKNTNNVYLINWLGYEYVTIPYKRKNRKHGESQWSFWKKVGLFVDTFFSFSNFPILLIRLLFLLLLFFFGLSTVHLFFNYSIESVILMATMGIAVLVTAVGLLISEYLDRIYETVRGRPSFVVEKTESNQK